MAPVDHPELVDPARRRVGRTQTVGGDRPPAKLEDVDEQVPTVGMRVDALELRIWVAPPEAPTPAGPEVGRRERGGRPRDGWPREDRSRRDRPGPVLRDHQRRAVPRGGRERARLERHGRPCELTRSRGAGCRAPGLCAGAPRPADRAAAACVGVGIGLDRELPHVAPGLDSDHPVAHEAVVGLASTRRGRPPRRRRRARPARRRGRLSRGCAAASPSRRAGPRRRAPRRSACRHPPVARAARASARAVRRRRAPRRLRTARRYSNMLWRARSASPSRDFPRAGRAHASPRPTRAPSC